MKNFFRVQIVSKVWGDKLISGSLLLLISSLLANFGNYFYHLLMGRFLGPIDYGVLASLISLTYFIGVLNTTLGLTVTKHVSSLLGKGKEKMLGSFYRKINKDLAYLVFPLGLFLLLISPLVANFLRLDSFWLVFLVFISGLVGFYTTVNNSILQSFLKFNWLSFLTVLYSLLKLGLSVLLVFWGWSVFGPVVVLFFLGLVVLVIGFWVVKRLIVSTKVVDSGFSWKPMLAYAFPALLSNLSLTSLYTSDIVLAKHFLSAQEAGHYAVLSLLGKIIFFTSSPIVTVMFPLSAKLVEKGQKYRQVLLSSLILVLLVSLGISLGYFLFPEAIVKLLFGNSYLPIAKYLFIFAVFISLYSLVSLLVNFYLSVGRTKLVYPSVLAAVVQIVLIFIFHRNIGQIILSSILVLGLLLVWLALYYWFNNGPKKK